MSNLGALTLDMALYVRLSRAFGTYLRSSLTQTMRISGAIGVIRGGSELEVYMTYGAG